ncbi:MAG: response regulator transcription factor [Leptolyngbyaceae cyanobacterium SM1_1_3]|nr:response regulator transcription factor [Leptolyngbyaceae cyanobacterium SM1_1_3]NJO10363.1 response regulator transcription factor [Leptolyngbyaceae cyanobacterium SL_1_1]
MSDRPLQLMLIDDDPVFRLGLRIWLEHFPEFQVVIEASSAEEALQALTAPDLTTPEPSTPAASPVSLDLVILDLGLGQNSPTQVAGLRLCQTLRSQFAQLPILVLSAHSEPILREAALQAGATSYGLRGIPVQQLVRLVRQTVRQTGTGQSLSQPKPDLPEPVAIPGPLTAMRISLRLSHLQQIEAEIAATLAEYQARSAPLYRAVMAGRYRELRAARWLVNRLLATPRFGRSRPNSDFEQIFEGEAEALSSDVMAPMIGSSAIEPVKTAGIVTVAADIRSFVFEAVFRKLQTSLANKSGVPLETDILRPEKKRELLYIVLRQLETLLDDIRYSQLQPGQLQERQSELLSDWWEAVVADFSANTTPLR